MGTSASYARKWRGSGSRTPEGNVSGKSFVDTKCAGATGRRRGWPAPYADPDSGDVIGMIVTESSCLRPGGPIPSGCVSQVHVGSFAKSGESSRHGPDGGESMSYSDDSNGTDPKQTPTP